MCNSFQTKGLLSTATGQLVVLDGLSSSAYFLVLEVFRLIRKVLCNRQSLPLHHFRRLVSGPFVVNVRSVLPVDVKWSSIWSSCIVDAVSAAESGELVDNTS